ncbi:hypothetical protein B0H13DRAFT_1954835 [Mycena leptocephala]|nr:hypothetical protein B0H13DRAFT_1954835 [Mycena leptocephala]
MTSLSLSLVFAVRFAVFAPPTNSCSVSFRPPPVSSLLSFRFVLALSSTATHYSLPYSLLDLCDSPRAPATDRVWLLSVISIHSTVLL